uniref:Uncharacterized protein n=1 Tax=Anguilla anguilla TaxID=7936 RepID=A0A0E9RWX3_ANGAN
MYFKRFCILCIKNQQLYFTRITTQYILHVEVVLEVATYTD